MKTFFGWVWWIVVQIVMGVWAAIGFLLLIPLCLAQAWTEPAYTSIGDKDRKVDRWKWSFIDFVYGNPEDGVSGKQALIWVNGVKMPYMPYRVSWPSWRVLYYLWDCWRAYCWSAWRNSTDGLKYVFAWKNGPRATLRGHKIGWWPENGFNVPLL